MKYVFTQIGRWLRQTFTRNLGMKIGALVFAFVLWSFVISDENPPREKIFRDVPVTFAATEELKEKDLTTSESFSDILKTATVTVRAEASSLQYITEDMISVVVDLSTISEVGEYTITLRATMASGIGEIISVQPENITFSVEELITMDVPVEVQYIGDRKEGYYYGSPVLSSNTVEVTGSRSSLEQVSKAICYIDINALDSTTKETRQVALYDADGNALESSMFSGIPSVIVEVPVYPKKEVTVDTNSIIASISGVAEGYEVTGVTTEPTAIEIAGLQEEVDPIESVSVTPIVLENASADVSVTAAIMLPEGVVAAVPQEVIVHISIAQPQITQTYDAMDIAYKNLENGFEATLDPESIDVNITGAKTTVEAITADQIRPFVDLEGLEEGTHTVDIKFENLPDLGVAVVPSVGSITVTIV